MKILTKKKMELMLKDVRRIVLDFDPLKIYPYTTKLLLYSRIKQELIKRA